MNETIRQIVSSIRENPEDATAYGALADAMDEGEVPGSAVVRAAGEHARTLDGLHGWAGVPDSARARRLLRTYYAAPTVRGELPFTGGTLKRNDTPVGDDDAEAHLPKSLAFQMAPHARGAHFFYADADKVASPSPLAPVKLARHADVSTHDGLIGAINDASKQEKTGHLPIFADALGDRGLPGSHLAREAGNHDQNQMYAALGSRFGDRQSEFFSLHSGRLWGEDRDTKSALRVVAPSESEPGGVTVWHGRDDGQAPGLIYRLPVKSLRHLYNLMGDVPAEARKRIILAAREYLPEKSTADDGKLMLARQRPAPDAPLSKDEQRVKAALAKPGTPRGLPPAPKLPRPLEDQREYHRHFGVKLGLMPFDSRPVSLANDPMERGKEIGAQYHAMPHDPANPETKAAYDQFKKEILLQHKFMTDRGLKVEPWKSDGQPYESSQHMVDSVVKHHHLFYFPTGEGQIPEDHPLAEAVPGMPGVSYNDLFRAVHDYFGHAVHRNTFGPVGEAKAYLYHRRMFSPLARKAMATETMGQNSWVNFGPHKPWLLPLKDRPFAPQKAGVLKLARSPSMEDLAGGYAKLDSFLTTGRNPDQRSVGPGGYVTRLADGHGIAVERRGQRLLIAHPDGTFTFPHATPTPTEVRIIHGISGASVGTQRGNRAWTGIYSLRGAPRQSFKPGERWHPETGYPSSERDEALKNMPAPILADWLADRGIPGSHIARAHQDGLARSGPISDFDPMTGKRGTVPAPAGQSRLDVFFGGHHGSPIHTISMIHAKDERGPNAFVSHNVRVHSLKHIYSLLSDFPREARRNIIRSLKDSGIPHRDPAGRDAGPVQLARVRMPGLGAATREGTGDAHAKRLELARRVFSEAGLKAGVRAVLAHTPQGSKPSVLAAAAHVANPQHALYAAAWLGLLSGEPRYTIFTPGEGEDTLHVFDTPHPAAHVAEYLKKTHAGPFVTEDRGGGTRVTIVTPLDQLDASTLARGLHASHSATRGRADRIGSSAGPDGSSQSAAAARQAYRTVIADAERSAGGD